MWTDTQTDGRTDITKFIVAFRNFAKSTPQKKNMYLRVREEEEKRKERDGGKQRKTDC